MTKSSRIVAGNPSPSVREVLTPDGAVLLDIRQRLCLGLTPVATEIWRLLKMKLSFHQIVNRLAKEFDAPQQVISDDVRDLLQEFQHKGILTLGPPLKTSARKKWSCEVLLWLHRRRHAQIDFRLTPRLLTIKAFCALLLFDLTGLAEDFVFMQDFISRWTARPDSPPADAVEKVCYAVNHACVWYPKRVLCLQRSAVTTCLMRDCGVPAQMVLGAQKMPFKAHAWTEVNCKPINERRDVQKFYLVWERG
jgi:hypothetical protein